MCDEKKIFDLSKREKRLKQYFVVSATNIYLFIFDKQIINKNVVKNSNTKTIIKKIRFIEKYNRFANSINLRIKSKRVKMVKNIMEALINVSEKAANIARVCRQNEHLFALLIQEKSSEESNSRFVKDFKTLADVLIQETIRFEVANLVSGNIFAYNTLRPSAQVCILLSNHFARSTII